MSEKHGEIENECSSVAVGKKATTTVGPQFCTASFSVGFKFSGPASVGMSLSISMIFGVRSRWFIVQFFGSYHFFGPPKSLYQLCCEHLFSFPQSFPEFMVGCTIHGFKIIIQNKYNFVTINLSFLFWHISLDSSPVCLIIISLGV